MARKRGMPGTVAVDSGELTVDSGQGRKGRQGRQGTHKLSSDPAVGGAGEKAGPLADGRRRRGKGVDSPRRMDGVDSAGGQTGPAAGGAGDMPREGVVDSQTGMSVSLESANLQVSLGVPGGVAVAGYCQQHVALRLNRAQGAALKRLVEALRGENRELVNGKRVESGAMAVAWLLEAYAAATRRNGEE